MSSFAVRTFNNNHQLINCLWLIYKQFSLIVKHPVYHGVNAGVLLSLHIITFLCVAGSVKFVKLCFVIVYKLPDTPSLHASELYLSFLFALPCCWKSRAFWLPSRLVKRAFNHRLQSSLGCITRLSVLL